MSDSTPTPSKDEVLAKIHCIEGGRRDADKGTDCSSSERPKSITVSELNICCFKEVIKLLTCNRFTETKLRQIQPLQNGENISSERSFRKRQLSLQKRPVPLRQDSQKYARFQ